MCSALNCVRDLAQASTGEVQLEDPPHDLGRDRLDLDAEAGAFDGSAVLVERHRHGSVAERESAGREPALCPTPEPALRVGAQLDQILLGHHAEHLRADVEEVEARARLEADALPGAQPVTNPAEVFGVAREPRRIPAEQHVPLADARKQVEQRRPVVA